MGLRDRLKALATATPAIPATHQRTGGESVATVAAVAVATGADEREICRLLALWCPEGHPDRAEALALALASPEVHLEGLRATAQREGLA